MLSIFIMLIIAIGLTAGIGYGVLTMIKTGELSLGIQRNQAQMEVVKAAITTNLKFRNGRVLVPVVVEGMDITTKMPSMSPFKKTAYDRDLVFCPVPGDPAGAPEMITGIPMEQEDGQYYAWTGPSTYSDSIENDRLRQNSVVAYIVVPAPYYDGPGLTCADMEIAAVDNLTMLATGGSVIPVFSTDLNSVSKTFSINSDEAMTNALGYIAQNGVSDATFEIIGAVTVDSADLGQALSGLKGRTLRLVGNLTNPGLLDFVGSTPASVTGNLFISHIDFGDTAPALVARPDGHILVENASVANVVTEGGRVTLGSNAVVSTQNAAAPVTIRGGTVSIASGVAISAEYADPVFAINGGQLHLDAVPSVVAGVTATLLVVEGGGRVTGTIPSVQFDVSRGGVGTLEGSIIAVNENCADGSATCVATCPAPAKIVSASCSSSNRHPLSGSAGIGQGAFTCEWAAPTIEMTGATEPRVSATCQ